MESIGVTLDKPQQLLNHGAEEDSLCSQEWKDVVLERESHGGRSKDGAGAGPCAVCAEFAVVHDVANHGEVLVFLMLVGCSPGVDGWREGRMGHAAES